MREGTSSRVMVVDRPYAVFYNVDSVSPVCLKYNLVFTAAVYHVCIIDSVISNAMFWGHAGAQLVEARRHGSKCLGFYT
jgi:hypothetical protein